MNKYNEMWQHFWSNENKTASILKEITFNGFCKFKIYNLFATYIFKNIFNLSKSLNTTYQKDDGIIF